MVSNSGTILIALRPEGSTSPTSFSSSATSSMSDIPLHIEMMHWGIASAPNLAWASAAAWNTASSPSVSSLYFTKARRQRPRIAQFARQQRDPRLLVQRQIGHAGHRRIDQLRDGAFVHGRILPDIEAGQMKAEAIHGPAQVPQPSARDHARIVRDQRAMENIEIGLELPDIGVRRGFADRRPGGFHIQPRGGRGEPGIDAGHRQPIGLAASMRRGIGRALGERAQILRDIGKMRRERQFGAEHVQFFEIKAQHAARLQLQRPAHHFRRHERVAVAVAADPASHPQERRQFARAPRRRPRSAGPPARNAAAAPRAGRCSRRTTGRWRPRRAR